MRLPVSLGPPRRPPLALLCTVLLGVSAAHAAAPGTLVKNQPLQFSCASGVGVGIAFDGQNLWASCANGAPDLYKLNPATGAVLASYSISSGLGALAWDPGRRRLWMGWGSSARDIRTFDPVTGASSIAFSFPTINSGLLDGLAYDPQDDSLYMSGDAMADIYHVSSSGARLRNFQYAGMGTPYACGNSGLSVGSRYLFQATSSCSHVFVVDKLRGEKAYDFSTNNARDEDLECDDRTFAPRTVMWTIDAYEPRKAIAYEVSPGSCQLDRDGDTIPDSWESNGVSIDPDDGGPLPAQFIDLKAMGADPNKPDLFVHLDWMANSTHSDKLSSDALRLVVEAFANAPYRSPTGSTGINLHVDQGPDSIMDFARGTKWGTRSRARQLQHVTPWSTIGPDDDFDWTVTNNGTPAFDTFKNDPTNGFTRTGRTTLFHYAISSHDIGLTGSSGLARPSSNWVEGSDFIVSLGHLPSPATLSEQAGTFMHELGHNLGLLHGGSDDEFDKPNYLSVMNYMFQFDGVVKNGTRVMDFSRAKLPTLNEAALVEPNGLGTAMAGDGTFHICLFATRAVADISRPIDWNCNNTIDASPVTQDLNGLNSTNIPLVGANDWALITFSGGSIGAFGAPYRGATRTRPNDRNTRALTERYRVAFAALTPPATVSTLAGSPLVEGSTDGTGAAARFRFPSGVVLNAAGTWALIADQSNHTVRRVDLSTNTVTTVAGAAGLAGSTNATGTAARFNSPGQIALSADERWALITDVGNKTVRRLDLQTLAVTTLAGSPGLGGTTDGVGSAARFMNPYGLAISRDGRFALISDRDAHTVRRLDLATLQVTTLAGLAGSYGSAEGVGTAARFFGPAGLDLNSTGTFAIIADQGNGRIRHLDLATHSVTTLAGGAGYGSRDGQGSAALLDQPFDVDLSNDDVVVAFTDIYAKQVRRLDLGTRQVTTVAGAYNVFGTTDGSGANARFAGPGGVILSGNRGFALVLDTNGYTLRKVTGGF